MKTNSLRYLQFNTIMFLYTLYLHHQLFMTYDHDSRSDSTSDSVYDNIITSLMVSMFVHLNYDHCLSNIYWSYLIGLNYNLEPI
jgi:membrane associated rhomboid family serine protease